MRHYRGYQRKTFHQERQHQHDFRFKKSKKWDHGVILEGIEISPWRIVVSRGKHKYDRGKKGQNGNYKKRRLTKEARTTEWNGYKCCLSILTSQIKVVSSNIWRSGRQVDSHAISLLWLYNIKSKCTCSQKEDINKSIKSRRKNFGGHNWSIPGYFDWEPVDLVHLKTSIFSIWALIWVNYNVVN